MKKALILVLAIALVAGMILWVASWFRNPEAVAAAGAREWPGGMGTLEDAAKRVAPNEANEASKRLTALASGLPKNAALDDFVAREVARGELTIGDPPSVPDLAAIRDLLLQEEVIWKRHYEVGAEGASNDRVAQMTIARALIASALSKARAGGPSAWDDLHAAWKLVQSLDGQPQMMTQTAALAIARMINAVGWKMPLPPPSWFSELQQYDAVEPLLASFQQQSASYWRDGARIFPTKSLASAGDHDRAIAEQLWSATNCDVNAPVNEFGADLTSVWRRAFRFRAEREATANALRVRQGQPIETSSRCRDGGWTLEGTTLRFTREIATAPPDAPMPLTLHIAP